MSDLVGILLLFFSCEGFNHNQVQHVPLIFFSSFFVLINSVKLGIPSLSRALCRFCRSSFVNFFWPSLFKLAAVILKSSDSFISFNVSGINDS